MHICLTGCFAETKEKNMIHKKHLLCSALLVLAALSLYTIPVLAAELTEAEVEQAVASQGKEAVTGNVFIWFLCAIAFLKVSQKIDSFMASLGINVGNTGGNMMSELLIAGRSLAGSMHLKGGGSTGSGGYRKASSPGDAAVGGSFLSGGLAGSVGRQTERSAVNAATQYTEHSSVGSSLYHSSLNKGGDFANNVISSIAQGNYSQVGSIKGEDAEKAYISYMGIKTESVQAGTSQPGTIPTGTGHNGMDQTTFSYGSADQTGFNGGGTNQTDPIQPIPSYTNIEIGGGRITGTEITADSGSRDFALYHADQYMAPSQGTYDTVQSVDGATWYKQYAQPAVNKIPYETDDGKVAYHESVVQKLPTVPQRKERI